MLVCEEEIYVIMMETRAVSQLPVASVQNGGLKKSGNFIQETVESYRLPLHANKGQNIRKETALLQTNYSEVKQRSGQGIRSW